MTTLRELVISMLTQDPSHPLLPAKATNPTTGEICTSLAPKQLGRGIAIAIEAGKPPDERTCSIKNDDHDPSYAWVVTTDPKNGVSKHLVSSHNPNRWEVFGVQMRAGGLCRTATNFSRWASEPTPKFDGEKPLNLAAINVKNLQAGYWKNARYADGTFDDKHLLAVAVARGTKFYVKAKDEQGNIPEWLIEAVEKGYTAEVASWSNAVDYA